MNRLFFIISLLFIFIIPQAWGATPQYPNPYRETMWNSLTDSAHTLGQSPQQAKLTKMRLRHARAMARFKSISQAKHQAWMKNNKYEKIQ